MKRLAALFLIACLALLSAGVFAQVPASKQIIPDVTHVYTTTGATSSTVYINFENRNVTPYITKSFPRGQLNMNWLGTGLNCQVDALDKHTRTVVFSGKAGKPTITGVSSTTATKDSLNRKWFHDNL